VSNEMTHASFRQYADWWLWALETLRGSRPRLRAAALAGIRAQSGGASVSAAVKAATEAFQDAPEVSRNRRIGFLPWRAARWLGYGLLYAIGAFFASVGVVGLSAGHMGTLKQLVVGVASLGLAVGTQRFFFILRRPGLDNLNPDEYTGPEDQVSQRYADLYARARLALRLDPEAAHRLATAKLPDWNPGTDISTVMSARINPNALVAGILLGAGVLGISAAIVVPWTFWWGVVPAFLFGLVSFDMGRSARARTSHTGERGLRLATISRNLGCLLAVIAPLVGLVILLAALASIAWVFGAPYTCAPNCP
jgi:hypothetical protein